jgi:RNA polymerase sigma-70 factor, ECF subfamily
VEFARVNLGDDIQKALLELPIEFREAVVMCDVVGLSYDEIAAAVAVPVGTVRSRIHRGRRLLRESLS